MIAVMLAAIPSSGATAMLNVAPTTVDTHKRALRVADADVTVSRRLGGRVKVSIFLLSNVFGDDATAFELELEPFTDLFAGGYKHIVIDADGEVVENADDEHAATPNCFYRTASLGHADGDEHGALLSLCGAAEGSVYAADGRHFYITPKRAAVGGGSHHVYLQGELV